MKLSNMDLDRLSPEDLQNGFGYLWNVFLEDEATQICGVVLMQNVKEFSVSKASQFNKSQEKKGQDDQYHFLQNCLPLRFKGVHIVHQPWWATMFINIAKPFMSSKLRSRVGFFVLFCVLVCFTKASLLQLQLRCNVVFPPRQRF